MPIQFPANPINGQVSQGYYYDANLLAWKASPISAGPTQIADTAPAGAIHGDMWYNSSDGSQYVYVNDGTSSQWVEVHSNTAALPGTIVQVVQGTNNSLFSTSSTSFVDTGLSATITPKFSNSKIAVFVNQTGFAAASNTATNNNNYIGNIVRGSTQLISCSNQVTVTGQTIWSNSLQFLDSPSTTSPTTYKTQAMVTNSSNGLFLQWPPPSGSSMSVITLMEVAQ